MDITATRAVLAGLLGKPVLTIARIGKGGNSKVYRIDCDDGSRYVAKFYFQRTADGLDRLDVEFSSMQMLWEAGERNVPEPLVADRANQIAVYQYVDGAQIDSRAASVEDIGQFIRFAKRLKLLATPARLDQLPRAAEACFSLDALHNNVLRRLERLFSVSGPDASYAALRRHLSEELAPALNAIVGQGREKIGKAAWTAELPRSAWTLSPSDFGFHNALRRPDGSILFLDFEYFGADDPAKMISDFVLHPAMQLGESIQHSYVEGMLDCFGADCDLPERLALSYPLFGLKWCTIMLNEFVPKFLERREFAIDSGADREDVRMRQLVKSEQMLRNIMNKIGTPLCLGKKAYEQPESPASNA